MMPRMPTDCVTIGCMNTFEQDTRVAFVDPTKPGPRHGRDTGVVMFAQGERDMYVQVRWDDGSTGWARPSQLKPTAR